MCILSSGSHHMYTSRPDTYLLFVHYPQAYANAPSVARQLIATKHGNHLWLCTSREAGSRQKSRLNAHIVSIGAGPETCSSQ